MPKSLIDAFHEEITRDLPKNTLHTANQDSLLLHKVVKTWRQASYDKQSTLLKMMLETSLPEQKKATSTKPHALPEKRTSLTQSPMCGAYARQTGKPCQQPAMRGSKRCRLHGGKSTGRPIKKGLRTASYKRHARKARRIVAAMMNVVV